MSDFIVSLIRTYVPIAVGAVASWAAVNAGFVVPDDLQAQAVAALTGVLIGVYYTLVRLLAQRWAKVEWLLGMPRTPTYEDTAPAHLAG